jgi:hypothetical protein
VAAGQGTQAKQGYGLVRCRVVKSSGGGVAQSRRAGATPARWEVGLFDHQESEPPPDLRRCSDSDESQPTHQGPNLSSEEYTFVIHACKRFFPRSPKISNVRNCKVISHSPSAFIRSQRRNWSCVARRFCRPPFVDVLASLGFGTYASAGRCNEPTPIVIGPFLPPGSSQATFH